MIAVLGALSEAWDEVRVHKSRVVLSLVGVFLAVFAMTSVTALGLIVAQVQQEGAERGSGRPATVAVNAYDPMTGMPPDAAEWDAAVAELVDRHGITTAATISYGEGLFRLPGGTQRLQTMRVSPAYGELHRKEPVEGRWLREGDRTSLSPALVVNEAFLELLGVPDLSSRPTVVLGGPTPVRATIVGVIREGYGSEPIVYRADRSGGPWDAPGAVDPATAMYAGPSTLELWVPPDQAEQVMEVVARDLGAALDVQVDTYRQDASGLEETLAMLRLAIRCAGIVVLVLGGLGVLNIGLVTVRQRIREIGVRRSFGATSGRIFSAVMLESVCATALAGVAAVGCSIVLVRNLPLEQLLNDGIPLADTPGFPVAAAVEGLVAATAVGALAGLLPALIAVRAKVIDAIRF
ncbi:ABC transporter permease [Blastococcus xanthinilyticus]|uniref:Putative ABC transport system permease protein n=1 Tax=Blastococcus xanthinilyticus TaxID=1564164 RepID=A0A5S5D4H5_9ACTN|nr:ABC transporter permease [Blastococcus xanthinilyticus]TYP90595.1 putative ABC transport system permease protein [Blastococcus xanthinilyticus]